MSETHASLPPFALRPARREDLAAICGLIHELAEFEQLSHLCRATPEALEPHLFGERPVAEAVVAEWMGEPTDERTGEWTADPRVVAFALIFTNFSTFLARPGLYLEDLMVKAELRGRGIGRALLQHLGALAVQRGCGRFEWSVLDWNADAIRFYEAMGAQVLPDWRICRVTGPALAAFARPASG